VGLYGIHFPADRFRPLSGMVLNTRTLGPVAALLVAVLLWLPIDPRPAVAAAVYIAPLLGGYVVTTIQDPPTGTDWWTVPPPLAIAAVTGTLVARERRPRPPPVPPVTRP
jgi:hypothetical protein